MVVVGENRSFLRGWQPSCFDFQMTMRRKINQLVQISRKRGITLGLHSRASISKVKHSRWPTSTILDLCK